MATLNVVSVERKSQVLTKSERIHLRKHLFKKAFTSESIHRNKPMLIEMQSRRSEY
ncbi:hypothetical protein [Vibrio alfacsensis]|uniref:hypothetical protein n=1 Tax=Vibrio alfacsensis TaxID=1074311 RepID=UPI001C80DC1B|nr:hypothetical protein [Vibrio alfacsensis]